MNTIELNMVEVPEGTFIMGANTATDEEAECEEEPERKIWLSAYKIQRTPVTVKLWMNFLISTGYHWHYQEEIIRNSPNELCPITYVSWFDANEFTKWLTATLEGSYSLPSESQWEKACRGECGQLYPWGNEEPEDYYTLPPTPKTLIPVGARPDRQSPYGCLDMWQNVAEWCTDWFDEQVYHQGERGYQNDPAKTVNPIGPATGRQKVWRGGANMWQSGWPRCSHRGFANPNFVHPQLGFRVVLTSRNT